MMATERANTGTTRAGQLAQQPAAGASGGEFDPRQTWPTMAAVAGAGGAGCGTSHTACTRVAATRNAEKRKKEEEEEEEEEREKRIEKQWIDAARMGRVHGARGMQANRGHGARACMIYTGAPGRARNTPDELASELCVRASDWEPRPSKSNSFNYVHFGFWPV